MLATRTDGLWFPGTAAAAVHESARAEQTSENREEMLRLLISSLPESEYELSFTDLVEKVAPANETSVDKARNSDEGSSNGSEAVKEKKIEKRRSVRMRNNSRGGNGGVLLNVYLPSSLIQSLTRSHTRRCSSVRERSITCCTSRDESLKEPATFGCWSSIWAKGKEKPRKH